MLKERLSSGRYVEAKTYIGIERKFPAVDEDTDKWRYSNKDQGEMIAICNQSISTEYTNEGSCWIFDQIQRIKALEKAKGTNWL